MKSRNLCLCLVTGLCLAAPGSPARAQNAVFNWARQLSGNYQDEAGVGNGIAIDADRNTYTVGSFSGNIDFDPSPSVYTMSSAGGIYFNAFITKLDVQGHFVWARQMGGTSGTEGNAIALDGDNNVYTTGYFQGTADFNPDPAVTYNLSIPGNDAGIFISKLDADGSFVWAKQIGDGGWDVGASMATDAAGNIYVSGQFDGTVDFDPGPGTTALTAAGSNDVFIIKLNPAGNLVWAKQIGGANGSIENKAITIDKRGNVITTGTFSGTLDFNPGAAVTNLSSSGWGSIYISKLDENGNFIFARKIGGANTSSGNAIALDQYDNILTAGFFSATVDFDPGPGVSNLSTMGGGFDFDVFISKIDSTGNYVWAKQIGGTSFEDCKAIGVDGKGNIYATGYFSGTTDFDPGPASFPLIAAGSDVYLAKLDSTGTFLWAKQIAESTNADYSAFGKGLVLDASQNIYTTGAFGGVMDFDPGPGNVQLNAGPLYSDDIFIHKMMCADTSSSTLHVTTEACSPYVLNGRAYTTSGTYTQVIPNAAGCDSTITLHLEIGNNLNITITNNNLVLQASASYSSYQWLKNNTAITGATAATYTVTTNGAYSLAATNSTGCTDTSNVLQIGNGTGINDIQPGALVKIYPNPASSRIYVTAPLTTDLILTSIEGKVLQEARATKTLDLSRMATGIYFLKVTDQAGNLLRIEKIVKEK
ncbi:SBBP repeat-containing protein [Taibaiella chishuiensis]|uniref:Putative secreted protein (Por secretion system target) n=1 Tax=Taibaiella chishuiensis TaxID=1434707 RepID=A0A2P8CZJ0_9BACT|nr:SBBP repeat-containing protein [Taibaiella chishuiensis]PSK90380.1 putative secreted protein (Por secretion system target) [Taibaiella chishuiensis]